MTSTEIYLALRKKIVNLDYEPGSLLNELDLSKEYGISRTPIRNALKMLELDKLVIIVPRYGVQVAQVDFRKMRSLFDMTKLLDPFAVKQACIKADKADIAKLKTIIENIEAALAKGNLNAAIDCDEEFHRHIVKMADNEFLAEELERLHLHSQRLWLYAKNQFANRDIFTRTFKEIVRAIEDGDADRAALYALEHINDFVDSIKEDLL